MMHVDIRQHIWSNEGTPTLYTIGVLADHLVKGSREDCDFHLNYKPRVRVDHVPGRTYIDAQRNDERVSAK